MSQYKPYSAYKDSGVEWLGEVPEHWELRKLKHMARFSGGGTPTRDNPEFWNGDIPWVSPKDMKSEFIMGAEECITAAGLAGSSSSMVPAERVLMVVRSGILKHTIPVAINQVPVALNQDMKAIWLDSDYLSERFFLRWVQGLNDDLLKVWLKQGATVESIEQEYLADTLMPVPPVREREHIVRHLDRETARIDALVAKKTRLIELLREKRQALITHAVTKGLDPNVKMKDSGVEWLGEVPEHWELKPLKYIGSSIIGLTYSPDDVVGEGEGVLVLRASNIQRGQLVLGDNVYVRAAIPPALVTREGDILICSRNGSRALIGKNALIGKEAAGHSFGAFTTVFRSASNQFVYYVLNSALFKFQSGRFLTTTINQLTTETLNSFEIPLPPPIEQIEIAKWLDVNLETLDAVVARTERSIGLLKERRSALITAAVTGQIDLREAV